MKVFLIFDNHGREAAHIIRELEKNSHEVLYWVGAQNEAVKDFPEIIFHDCADARRALPAEGVEAEKYSPPGAELIRRMAAHESLQMTLANKLFPNLSHDERKHIYFELLGYWNGVLQEYRPDMIIFLTSPHTNYNCLIYELTKIFGIKTLMFSDTWVSDRTLPHHDLWGSSPDLIRTLRANRGKEFSVNDLSADIRTYYRSRIKARNQKQAQPWYIDMQKNQLIGKNFLRNKTRMAWSHLWRGKIFGLIKQFARNRIGSNVQKEYQKFAITPDWNKKFVYLPLQYQPERTTSPQGDMFADQILMAEILSAALPQDWAVYVKEHPHQWWQSGLNYSPFRYPGYYERIAGLKNTFLVPIETDSFQLIDRCRAVVTVTGTAGWEALLRGKPAVTFGYPWYQDCPELLRADSVENCRAALKKIADGFEVDRANILNYLKSLDEASVRCYVDDFYNQDASDLSFDQRINNLNKVILEETKYV